MYNGLDKSLTIGLGNDALLALNRPMSHNARKLMVRMITWAAPKFAKDYNNNRATLLTDFASSIDHAMYEWVVQRYDVSKYPGNGRSEAVVEALGKFGTPKEKAIGMMTLMNFNDSSWIELSGLTHNHGHVGNILAPHTRDVYSLLTTRFLLSDFNEHDLNKICEIGSMRISMSTLQSHISSISDVTKRGMAYLFAIIRDTAIKEAYSKDMVLAEESKQRDALARVMKYADISNRTPFVAGEDLESTGTKMEAYSAILDKINNE